jgi:hypothetical protein
MKLIKLNLIKNKLYKFTWIIIVLLSVAKSMAQSVHFSYSPNRNIVKKEVDIDKKEYKINGDSVVCKGKVVEYSISTNETARWSNGTNGAKASYTITRDTIIKAIVTNKYGCEHEQVRSIKAADLPVKPIITRNGNTLSVTNVTGNFEWYRNNQLFSVGLASINTTLEGNYIVKVINANGCENISDAFDFQSGSGSTPPPWTKLPTGQNHTIIVPVNVVSEIGGLALKNGDFIGIFFNRDGQTVCSNFEEWKGSAISIAAFGNDANPPSKNGFNTNEQFQVKVWRSSESKEYTVQATFEDPPQFPRDATDKWKKDGLSLIKSLKTSNKVTQIINLRQNWNTISAYVIPDSPNMLDILATLGNKVVLIKDEKGNSAIPSQGINNLGTWDVKKGYQIRMTENTTLSITGTKANLSANPISISSEWKIISYLCDYGNTPASQFSSVASSIVLIKDQDGKSYIPSAGVDGLGCLKPGLGYHVRGINNASFAYNCAGNCNPLQQEIIYSRSSDVPYNKDPLNSGNNATVVFTQQVCESFLQPGEMIYVFNSSGVICGKWKNDGTAFAMPVWGDDLYTDDVIDGFIDFEPMQFKIRSLDGSLYNVGITFKDTDNMYTRDGIYYVTHVEKDAEEKNQNILIYPNPTSQWVNISYISDNIPQKIEVCIFDVQGKMVQKYENKNPETNDITIPVQSLNSGIYLFRISMDKQSYYKKSIYYILISFQLFLTINHH